MSTREPAGLPEHACTPCPRCRVACACRAGLCQACTDRDDVDRARREALADRARYEQELTQPDLLLYAVTGGSTARLHTASCPTIHQSAAAAQTRLEQLTPRPVDDSPEDPHELHRRLPWPQLLDRTRALALRRRRCRTCAPDLPAGGQQPVRRTVTGLGWPSPSGEAAGRPTPGVSSSRPPR